METTKEKNTVTGTPVETSSISTNAFEAIKALNFTGEILLDKLEKEKSLKQFSRHDLIIALKEMQSKKIGTFLVGRRGAASRFLHGVTKEQNKAKNNSNNNKKRQNEQLVVTQHNQITNSLFRISIAGQQIDLPVKMELVA